MNGDRAVRPDGLAADGDKHAGQRHGRAKAIRFGMPDRSLRPRSGGSAKALLLTLFGEFSNRFDGAMWTSTVIEALALFDVTERNARQAVARLADDDVLISERQGRRTRWHLTARGRELLTDGTERIYAFGTDGAAWDGRWLVVLASVPEGQRAKRHQLRSRLEFAGLGFIGAGVAVTPHTDREDVVNRVLTDLGLDDSAVVFLASTGSFAPDEELIRRGWDVEEMSVRYATFIGAFAARRPSSDAESFAALVDLVHDWRRFPFGDPEIPDALLPSSWPGHEARQVFDRSHAAWSAAALRWYVAFEADAAKGG